MREYVGNPISIGDKTNLQYINVCKPHITIWFCEDELGLNSLLNTTLKAIVIRFFGPIVSLLSDHPHI